MKHTIILATCLLALVSCLEVRSRLGEPVYEEVPLIEKHDSVRKFDFSL
jgi:hypothetical protein